MKRRKLLLKPTKSQMSYTDEDGCDYKTLKS